jgi:hypothetical protein
MMGIKGEVLMSDDELGELDKELNGW